MSGPDQEHRQTQGTLNSMIQLSTTLIKSYSNRKKNIINQGTFQIHWWVYQVGG